MKFINQMEPVIGIEEQRAVNEYLKSGGWITEFRKTQELEESIARYTGAKYASMVTSGTIALGVALMARGIGLGDEVIVPDYTMIASANSVKLAGATPVFVDVDPTNLCLDIEKTKAAIGGKTKAIMVVSMNGRAPDMRACKAIAKKHNLFLLEDSAQSLGSRFGGKHLGMWGDAGIFSFSTPKIITTGQGGVVITNNKKLYDAIQKIKDFGRQVSGIDLHDTLGYNFKFTDIQAVIGIEQMKKLSGRVKRKKEMFVLYQRELEAVAEVEFIPTNLKDTAPWFADILVPAGKRKGLIQHLKENDIGARQFYPAVHTQAPYKNTRGSFPNALDASRRGLWLPSSVRVTDREIVRVTRTIKSFFRS